MMKDDAWKIEAYHAARKALKRHVVPFVAEKLRADVEAVIGPAKDGRSFGAVIQRLKSERVIKRAGKEYEACCPFHDERTPSFTVIPHKGFFHCFGCGAHGDVIGFYQQITGKTFREAVADLGGDSFADAREIQRAQVELDPSGRWIPLMPVPADAPARWVAR